MIRNKYFIMLLAVSFLFVTGLNNRDKDQSVLAPLNSYELERTDGGYYTFIDGKTKRELDHTSRIVYPGDQLILGDNSFYEVTEIQGDLVYCQFKGIEKLSWPGELTVPVSLSGTILTQNEPKGRVALYSTHTSESYVPTSGRDSIPGDGDILHVLQKIGTVLEKENVEAIVSLNRHEPHDANAYHRSRRTAVSLLKHAPVTIIDVHRDGVYDPNYYLTEIEGERMTKIRLVVGRQNQNMQANLDFAKSAKAYYDQMKPGLIKGIYIAKGNYNQDLYPRSLLLEVGTHTNSLEEAQKGASVFAANLPAFLGVDPEREKLTPQQRQQQDAQQRKGVFSSLLWIIILLIIGSLGFLLISAGSIKGAVQRIKDFPKEFSDLRRKGKS